MDLSGTWAHFSADGKSDREVEIEMGGVKRFRMVKATPEHGGLAYSILKDPAEPKGRDIPGVLLVVGPLNLAHTHPGGLTCEVQDNGDLFFFTSIMTALAFPLICSPNAENSRPSPAQKACLPAGASVSLKSTVS